MERIAITLVSVAAALLPAAARADYLYDLWSNQEGRKPYVMVVLDTSASMDANDGCAYGTTRQCVRGFCTDVCRDRMSAAQDVLRKALPGLADDVGLGLMVFATDANGGTLPDLKETRFSKKTDSGYKACGVRTVAPAPTDYGTIDAALATRFDIRNNTPIAFSLKQAGAALASKKQSDGAGCRDYYVLLVTDGEESCAADPDTEKEKGATAVLTQIRVLRSQGIRTFVVGFGKDLSDTNGTSNASRYARAGGTAVSSSGEFVCWDDAGCGGNSTARAMFAYGTSDLETALTRSFGMVRRGIFSAAEPVIGSVPLERSEIDRIRRNFLVYSAFEMEGDQRRGHLYGIRLFKETSAYSGTWHFTDMSTPAELLKDCGPDQTCVFDAGQMLADRTKARKIYTGEPDQPDTSSDGFRLPIRRAIELPETSSGSTALKTQWSTFSNFAAIKAALKDTELPANLSISGADLRAPSDSRAMQVIDWLHGPGRNWPLGDILHGSPTVVEPPSYGYRDRGYPQFRQAQAKRPWMTYVGANDGMIHAFYASPDFFYEAAGETQPRWQPGEEAWAYLPVNQIGRTFAEVAAGSQRFFSQDLSCRYTDAILEDKVNADGELDCGDDPNCGWGTVLLCGQGWGGSWYVAIDVTDPSRPRPLWELTVPGSSSDKSGLGRTWSVPSINLLRLAGKPTWTALFGNGYNADAANCPTFNPSNKKCSTSGGITWGTKASYRMLNLPFEGAWPVYGDGTDGDQGHAWLVDLATGALLKTLHLHEGGGKNMMSVVADVASIDTDWNGMIDAAYVGGWDGTLARIYFGDKETSSLSSVGACFTGGDRLVVMANSRPITSNPAVVAHPTRRDRVHLFVGSGVDSGTAPDQQRSEGNQWDFRAFQFDDDGSSTCPSVPNAGNMCGQTDWKLSDSARLLGQPLFSRQANGHDWLLYTTWSPAPISAGCQGSGTARLACIDVTNPDACTVCGDLTGDGGASEREAVIDTGGLPPAPPVVVDGNVYMGASRTPITDTDGNVPIPNALVSRTVTLSWREVF